MTFDVVSIGKAMTSAMVVCWCGDVFNASGTHDDVSRKQRKWEKKHKDCKEQAYEAKTFWLSFCDADRPKGQQFLGACIVDVTPEEVKEAHVETMMRFPMARPGAEYIAAAIKKAHALGCNPGGEVATNEMPSAHPNMAFYQLGVLMDRETIAAIDARIAEQRKK